jgi:hypothetical protein
MSKTIEITMRGKNTRHKGIYESKVYLLSIQLYSPKRHMILVCNTCISGAILASVEQYLHQWRITGELTFVG